MTKLNAVLLLQNDNIMRNRPAWNYEGRNVMKWKSIQNQEGYVHKKSRTSNVANGVDGLRSQRMSDSKLINRLFTKFRNYFKINTKFRWKIRKWQIRFTHEPTDLAGPNKSTAPRFSSCQVKKCKTWWMKVLRSLRRAFTDLPAQTFFCFQTWNENTEAQESLVWSELFKNWCKTFNKYFQICLPYIPQKQREERLYKNLKQRVRCYSNF